MRLIKDIKGKKKVFKKTNLGGRGQWEAQNGPKIKGSKVEE